MPRTLPYKIRRLPYNLFMNPASPTDVPQVTSGASPRAFAIGTGFAFQTVGGLLASAAAVMAVIAAWAIPGSKVPVEQWTQFFSEEHLPSALWTILLITSLIGGLAMAAVGVGLQGENRNSGRVALVISAIMGLAYFCVAGVFIVAADRVFPALVAIVLAALAALMFLLAGHSATVLRQYPPPPDLNAATPELLEEYRQKRLERLKHYEP